MSSSRCRPTGPGSAQGAGSATAPTLTPHAPWILCATQHAGTLTAAPQLNQRQAGLGGGVGTREHRRCRAEPSPSCLWPKHQTLAAMCLPYARRSWHHGDECIPTQVSIWQQRIQRPRIVSNVVACRLTHNTHDGTSRQTEIHAGRRHGFLPGTCASTPC